MLDECLNYQELVSHLNGRFYNHFFSFSLRLILPDFLKKFNLLNNSFHLFLIIGLVLITCNSGSKISAISTL